MNDEVTWKTAPSPDATRAPVDELFHHHYRRLVGLASLLVDDHETAEEVVQEAFESLVRNWPGLRDPHAAVAYLNKAVVNRSHSKVRRLFTERRHALPEADIVESAEASGVWASERSELMAAVRRLPRRQREVVVLRYFLNLSEEQIAESLGVSRGSVKTHASRAAAALRQRMEAWT